MRRTGNQASPLDLLGFPIFQCGALSKFLLTLQSPRTTYLLCVSFFLLIRYYSLDIASANLYHGDKNEFLGVEMQVEKANTLNETDTDTKVEPRQTNHLMALEPCVSI